MTTSAILSAPAGVATQASAETAISNINDALKIEPENAYLYLLKAKLNKFLYQNDESLKNLEKAVSYGISREYAEAFVSEAAQN